MAEATSITKAKPLFLKGKSCDENSLDLKHWENVYNERQFLLYHEGSGNKLMWDFMNENYLKNTNKALSETKVFVPMCGKAEDMWMLYELGFTVVGVECVDHYIEDFFKEHNLKPKIGKILNDAGEQVDEYSSPDRRLVLFAGDLLHLTYDDLPTTKFDIIWDRHAFTVLNLCDRDGYASLTSRLLVKDGVYLMTVMEFDPRYYGGPPANVGQECLLKSFGDKCAINEFKRINFKDHPRREKMRQHCIPDHADEVLYIMKFQS